MCLDYTTTLSILLPWDLQPKQIWVWKFWKDECFSKYFEEGKHLFPDYSFLVLEYTVSWDAVVCESIVRSRRRALQLSTTGKVDCGFSVFPSCSVEDKILSFKKSSWLSFVQQVCKVTCQVMQHLSESFGKNGNSSVFITYFLKNVYVERFSVNKDAPILFVFKYQYPYSELKLLQNPDFCTNYEI